eukprot:TRINITY_DN5650_c0_g2_i1.p1 TRINITY_DN5650_c0_g2~~TRINITY_DN5650_c0_g2_i1.p1  ORF type:complete len:652 (+),score=93.64 TRINITY_DN5650_c0_g2_i1:89-2044(+)
MEDVLSPDKIHELRRIVDSHLRESNVYGQVRELLLDYTAREGNEPNVDTLLSLVQERGCISRLIDSAKGAKANVAENQGKTLRPNDRYLHIRLLGGRAFLEHLDSEPSKHEKLIASLQFGSHRFTSKPTICSCDPPFDDSFLVNVDTELTNNGTSEQLQRMLRHQDRRNSRDLMKLNQKIHIVLLRYNSQRDDYKVIGENQIEWRNCLKSGSVSLSVEMGGGNHGLRIPIGVMELQLEILPYHTAIGGDDIQNQINSENSDSTASEREFLVYARRWWQEYHAYSPSFASRNVKVFANIITHLTQMAPVTSTVSVLRPDRILDSPYECARFVSLLTFDYDDDRIKHPQGVSTMNPAKPATDGWLNQFSFISRKKGDVPEHCTLLTSLLLGHGLDAWVVLGTDASGQRHMSVMSRSKSSDESYSVILWNPMNGERHAVESGGSFPSSWLGVTHIHSAFTDGSLVASLQSVDEVHEISFDFDDDRLWKSMNPIKLKLVKKQPQPTITPSSLTTVDISSIEQEMEAAMMQAVTDYRDQRGLITTWDMGSISYIMTQALWSLEFQKITSVPLEMDSFHASIRKCIQSGRLFTGFPIHFTHRSPSRMMSHLASSKHTTDILELQGDDIRHTIRIKITSYPEDLVSVWVMIGAVYTAM